MKSRNLTQSSLRNDPINRRMQGFSFWIDEDENWSSRWDFFLLFRSKFDFKHSIEAEMSQEHYETKGTRIEAPHRENLMKNRERFLSAWRTSFIKTILILGRPMKVHHDQRPRSRVRWSNRHLEFSIVGFRSYGFDLIGDPLRANNLSRYNCEIGRWILIHLNGFEARVVWSGGPRVHWIDARDPSQFHRTLHVNLKMKVSPTPKKLREWNAYISYAI